MNVQYKQVVIWDANIIDVGFLGSEQSVPLALRGLAINGVYILTGAPAATVGVWAPGAQIYNAVDGTMCLNTGTTAAPVWGLVENSGDQPIESIAFNSDATAGPSTILAAKVVNAILSRDGGVANRADTTDTAAAILAAVPGAAIGTTFRFFYKNASTTDGQINTLSGGSGVTITGNANVAAGRVQEYIARFTNVTVAALTLYAVNSVAGVVAQSFPASSVNTFLMTGAVAGAAPKVAVVGSDANIGLQLLPKGTGKVGSLSPVALAQVPNYIATESGANNAIAGALLDMNGVAIPLAAGLEVVVKLGHTLQAGANTFNFNGGGALAINSHLNVANNLGTAYAATGVIKLLYTGAVWADMSQ